MSRVVAVVGPTATGKSDLAVDLALALGGEVVNADSMQLYEGMDIGTAKLTARERRGVPHALLDVWPVTRTATAADYQGLCRGVLDALLARGVTPVLVGGSGLYLRAALDDLRFPGTDPVLRARLEADLGREGPYALHARLAALDPEAATRMEAGNGRRVVRALEVVTLTGAMPGAMTTYDAVYDVVQVGPRRAPTCPSGSRGGSTGCGTRACSTRWPGSATRAARGRHRRSRARVRPGAGAAGRAADGGAGPRGDRGRDPAVRPPPASVVPARPADRLARPRRQRARAGAAA